MRRRWTIAVAAAVIGASLAVTAPAGASGLADCDLGEPPERTVIQSDGTNLNVYPLNLPADALAVGGWVAGYALCLEGGIVTGPVECVRNGSVWLPPEPVVTVDPDEPSVSVNYGQFFEPAGDTCVD
jgi:hypothetical protein